MTYINVDVQEMEEHVYVCHFKNIDFIFLCDANENNYISNINPYAHKTISHSDWNDS